jgi:hypothetical protein
LWGWSMIPKSGNRFSEEITRKTKIQSGTKAASGEETA